MIKVKLAEIAKHRNETTFRPFIMTRDLFRDVGVQFVTEGPCDLTWVGQASYNDRKDFYEYEHCLSRGRWFIENEVKGDYVLFDGQDSASLLGSFDILKSTKAKFLFKNTLYKTFEDYMEPWTMGRMYWGKGGVHPYALEEADRERFNDVRLSGCNWLSTITPHWFDYTKIEKDIDVFAMFSYPCRENWEYKELTNGYYDEHRRKCIEELNKIPSSIKVAKLENGVKVPIEKYYDLMRRSKIVIAPFGYGEIAPRDIEAAQFGAVLIKPLMDHIETVPNVYLHPRTYIHCNWDYSNLTGRVDMLLDKFKYQQEYLVENMRQAYTTEYNPEKLVMHTYDWLTKLEGFGTEG